MTDLESLFEETRIYLEAIRQEVSDPEIVGEIGPLYVVEDLVRRVESKIDRLEESIDRQTILDHEAKLSIQREQITRVLS